MRQNSSSKNLKRGSEWRCYIYKSDKPKNHVIYRPEIKIRPYQVQGPPDQENEIRPPQNRKRQPPGRQEETRHGKLPVEKQVVKKAGWVILGRI